MSNEQRHRMRDRLAQETARLMYEQGIDDPARARSKIMQRMGMIDRHLQPDLAAIEQALADHQRLFAPAENSDLLHDLRQAALEAMRFLRAFHPRLTGSVLHGTIDRYSPVCLHLHPEHPDQVAAFLHEHGIVSVIRERRMTLARNRTERVPVHEFRADAHAFELMVLPAECLRQSPLDADGKALQRASERHIEALLADGTSRR